MDILVKIKKNILYALINNLYGRYPNLKQKDIELKINSENLNISYLESDDVIEISPSSYGNKDKKVVQILIKELAQNRSVMSLFSCNKPLIKILINDKAEDLS